MKTIAKRTTNCTINVAALHAINSIAIGQQTDDKQQPTQKTLQERVDALEKKLDSPDYMRAYWKNGLKFESADKNFTMGIGGRIHFDSEFNDTEKSLESTKVYATPGNAGTATAIGGQTNDWEIRRARININGKLYQHFEFVDQFDFAGGGNGGNGVQQKDVYVGMYSLGDWILDVRVG